jgi:hypothetical protein
MNHRSHGLSAAVSAALLGLLLLSTFNIVPQARAQSATGSIPAALSLSVGPDVLPADGGTYAAIFVSLAGSSGVPTLALVPVTILLSSSDPDVGTLLNTTVTVPAGKGTVVASFQTSTIAGSTTITATSTGLASTSTQVTTAFPTGYPSKLAISATPNNVPASQQYKGTLVIELEDEAGIPSKAVATTTVQLLSSNTQLLNLTSSSLTIPAGQFSVEGNFTTGAVPGTTSVVATAPGLTTGTVSVTIQGVSALVLRLSAMPAVAAACESPELSSSCSGPLVISLSDLAGNPVRAPLPVTVQLRSSDTGVIGLAVQSVTIPQGNASAVAYYTTTSAPGSAVITASAPGFATAEASITTNPPTNPPMALALEVSPPQIPADECSCAYAVVSLLDQFGNATIASSPITVTLTSSVASIANFTDNHLAIYTVTIGTDTSFATVALTSTFVSGATTFTASATNVATSQVSLETLPAVPSKVAVTPIFPSVPADGQAHPALMVSLLDSSGHPFAGSSGTLVFLNSSQPGVAAVSSPVTVPAGQSAILVPITTSFIAGASNITATINGQTLGFAVDSVLVSTVTPAPSRVAIFVEPNPLAESPLGSQSTLFVQLQDANGNPAKARVNTTVTLVSSNAAVFGKNLTVIIGQGLDYVPVKITPLAAGTTTFEATSSNLSSGSAGIEVLDSSFSASLFPSSALIYTNQTATVTLTLKLDGQVLPGIKILWNTTAGGLSSPNSTTDSNGQASVVFTPNGIGVANVTATATSPIIGNQFQNVFISINPPPVIHKKASFAQLLLTFPYVLIIVAVVAVAVLVVFMFLRRRGKGGEGEEEGEAGFMFLSRPISGGQGWVASL